MYLSTLKRKNAERLQYKTKFNQGKHMYYNKNIKTLEKQPSFNI